MFLPRSSQKSHQKVGGDVIIIQILRVFAVICIAIIVGKIVAKFKLPAFGLADHGIVFGPYLTEIVTLELRTLYGIKFS